MSDATDSIYPAFLETGLSTLHHLGAQREVVALFTALENFRRDLHATESAEDILHVTRKYIGGLKLFQRTAFYLVNPSDFGFEMKLCHPASARAGMEAWVQGEIKAGRFAWALRQAGPVFLQAKDHDGEDRGVFHPLAIANQVLGLFCGVLGREVSPVQEIAFSVLSILLGASADALATARKTTQLTNQIKTLNGLLPICAWCKKIRDDKGYWDQIENYIETRSEALFSHGICPECRTKHFGKSG
ncbi:MAG: hypothetical protein HZA90_02265 [Verrucomicrobia bacterium]|nr:hypothetical protein [Verrucomicrobiota bacterium]